MAQEPKKERIVLLIESLFPDGSLVMNADGSILESTPGCTPVYVTLAWAQYRAVEAMKEKGIFQEADQKVVEKWCRILPKHKAYEQLTEASRAGFLLYEYADVLFPVHENQETETNP